MWQDDITKNKQTQGYYLKLSVTSMLDILYLTFLGQLLPRALPNAVGSGILTVGLRL